MYLVGKKRKQDVLKEKLVLWILQMSSVTFSLPSDCATWRAAWGRWWGPGCARDDRSSSHADHQAAHYSGRRRTNPHLPSPRQPGRYSATVHTSPRQPGLLPGNEAQMSARSGNLKSIRAILMWQHWLMKWIKTWRWHNYVLTLGKRLRCCGNVDTAPQLTRDI